MKFSPSGLAALTALSAVHGLLSGCSEKAPEPKETAARAEPLGAPSGSAKKDCCTGKNECKGKGGCKTDKNECAGKNECKGKGGCSMRDCS